MTARWRSCRTPGAIAWRVAARAAGADGADGAAMAWGLMTPPTATAAAKAATN
jgi:hypothetical protein